MTLPLIDRTSARPVGSLGLDFNYNFPAAESGRNGRNWPDSAVAGIHLERQLSEDELPYMAIEHGRTIPLPEVQVPSEHR